MELLVPNIFKKFFINVLKLLVLVSFFTVAVASPISKPNLADSIHVNNCGKNCKPNNGNPFDISPKHTGLHKPTKDTGFNALNDLKEKTKNSLSNNIKDTYDTGTYSTVCWIEIKTITEYLNGSEPTIIYEYAISFDTPSDIPKEHIEEKEDGTIFYKNTKKSYSVPVEIIKKTNATVIKKHKNITCGSGPLYTREINFWPSKDKKKFEIKVSPKNHTEDCKNNNVMPDDNLLEQTPKTGDKSEESEENITFSNSQMEETTEFINHIKNLLKDHIKQTTTLADDSTESIKTPEKTKPTGKKRRQPKRKKKTQKNLDNQELTSLNTPEENTEPNSDISNDIILPQNNKYSVTTEKIDSDIIDTISTEYSDQSVSKYPETIVTLPLEQNSEPPQRAEYHEKDVNQYETTEQQDNSTESIQINPKDFSKKRIAPEKDTNPLEEQTNKPTNDSSDEYEASEEYLQEISEESTQAISKEIEDNQRPEPKEETLHPNEKPTATFGSHEEKNSEEESTKWDEEETTNQGITKKKTKPIGLQKRTKPRSQEENNSREVTENFDATTIGSSYESEEYLEEISEESTYPEHNQTPLPKKKTRIKIPKGSTNKIPNPDVSDETQTNPGGNGFVAPNSLLDNNKNMESSTSSGLKDHPNTDSDEYETITEETDGSSEEITETSKVITSKSSKKNKKHKKSPSRGNKENPTDFSNIDIKDHFNTLDTTENPYKTTFKTIPGKFPGKNNGLTTEFGDQTILSPRETIQKGKRIINPKTKKGKTPNHNKDLNKEPPETSEFLISTLTPNGKGPIELATDSLDYLEDHTGEIIESNSKKFPRKNNIKIRKRKPQPGSSKQGTPIPNNNESRQPFETRENAINKVTTSSQPITIESDSKNDDNAETVSEPIDSNNKIKKSKRIIKKKKKHNPEITTTTERNTTDWSTEEYTVEYDYISEDKNKKPKPKTSTETSTEEWEEIEYTDSPVKKVSKKRISKKKPKKSSASKRSQDSPNENIVESTKLVSKRTTTTPEFSKSTRDLSDMKTTTILNGGDNENHPENDILSTRMLNDFANDSVLDHVPTTSEPDTTISENDLSSTKSPKETTSKVKSPKGKKRSQKPKKWKRVHIRRKKPKHGKSEPTKIISEEVIDDISKVKIPFYRNKTTKVYFDGTTTHINPENNFRTTINPLTTESEMTTKDEYNQKITTLDHLSSDYATYSGRKSLKENVPDEKDKMAKETTAPNEITSEPDVFYDDDSSEKPNKNLEKMDLLNHFIKTNNVSTPKPCEPTYENCETIYKPLPDIAKKVDQNGKVTCIKVKGKRKKVPCPKDTSDIPNLKDVLKKPQETFFFKMEELEKLLDFICNKTHDKQDNNLQHRKRVLHPKGYNHKKKSSSRSKAKSNPKRKMKTIKKKKSKTRKSPQNRKMTRTVRRKVKKPKRRNRVTTNAPK